MIRFEFLLIRGNMAPTEFLMTLETLIASMKHRYVAMENKAEYDDTADFADVDLDSIASKSVRLHSALE